MVAVTDIPIRGTFDIANRSVGKVTSVRNTSEGVNYTVYFIGRDKSIRCKPNHVRQIDPMKTGKPRESGDPYPVKICNMCHLLKDQSTEFQRNQVDSRRRITTRPSCNTCREEIEGDPMEVEERRRMNAIKPAELSIFTCPLCHKRTIVGVTAKIVMDHTARGGRGREWICDSCNTGLGRFRDEIPVIERLIEYLQRYD